MGNVAISTIIIVIGIIVLAVGYAEYRQALNAMTSTTPSITAIYTGAFLIVFGLVLAIFSFRQMPPKLVLEKERQVVVRKVSPCASPCPC